MKWSLVEEERISPKVQRSKKKKQKKKEKKRAMKYNEVWIPHKIDHDCIYIHGTARLEEYDCYNRYETKQEANT